MWPKHSEGTCCLSFLCVHSLPGPASLPQLISLHLYRHLQYNMRIGQLTSTLIRNQVYMMLLCHWAACWWYW